MCGTINELYHICLISKGNICFNLFKIQIFLEHAFDIFQCAFFQFIYNCIYNVSIIKIYNKTQDIKIRNLFNIYIVYLQGKCLYICILKYHVF